MARVTILIGYKIKIDDYTYAFGNFKDLLSKADVKYTVTGKKDGDFGDSGQKASYKVRALSNIYPYLEGSKAYDMSAPSSDYRNSGRINDMYIAIFAKNIKDDILEWLSPGPLLQYISPLKK